MTFSLPLQQIRFFITAAAPCPYLPDREETKLFTYLSMSDGRELNDTLTAVGFRRAQNIIYRPVCTRCNACKSCRVLVADFVPSKNLRRILAKNLDLTRTVHPPKAKLEHFALISRYLSARHASGGMEGMDENDFSSLVEETSVATELVEYRDRDGQLLACALIDQLHDGPSMLYSFFDPQFSGRSLGMFMILDHIARAKNALQPYLYLGFWIQDSPKMNYKQRFRPLEILHATTWELLGETP
ncbi:MAG: arginyltransferase [Robiginitomaculum sp.]|nr:arginyltransferase [Robiginitomaculum sp.]